MFELLKNKRIMVVVAHPDDELLGLGGTLNRLSSSGNHTIHVVILGEGITSRGTNMGREVWKTELKKHNENIETAKKHIGYESLATYGLPDNRFDSVDLLDIVKIVEDEKDKFKPEVILTHHGGDLNVDHQRTFEAVMTACRPMDHEKAKYILTFETPSGTEWQSNFDPRKFNPNVFIALTEENIEVKIRGMESYEYEKRGFPHPRSPEALRLHAKYRGMAVGLNYAEAFQLIRSVSN
jgi:LmbE family N-acetylglucosaminyl deacetylase